MKSIILLKLNYLLDNFESIDEFEILIRKTREENEYFIIVYKNSKYFSTEELKSQLLDYFEDLPIEVIVVEGKE